VVDTAFGLTVPNYLLFQITPLFLTFYFLLGRRNVFVGIHVPYTGHHHHHHRKNKHKKKRRKERTATDGDHTPPSLDTTDGLVFEVPREPPKTPADPCDRVKFILGGEDVESACESHEVFTELEELCTHHGQPIWKETARWLKFEEDVEEEGDKWSKPHVATLSLHSLFELRSNLLHGTVLLDVDATNLAHIADIVLDNLVSTDQLKEDAREKVREALLIPHHHHQDQKENEILRHIKHFADMKRTNSNPRKLEDFKDNASCQAENDNLSSSNLHITLRDRSLSLVSNLSSRIPWLSGSARGSPQNSRSDLNAPPDITITGTEGEEQQYKHPKSKLLRKIPQGAEASNVLVGEVDYLEKPLIAFVRLANAVLLGDLTEVPIPTRFLFILLGPVGNRSRFHEVGRSVSTLMADEVFRDVAYKARNRGDLIAGVDEFLDKVTVLPPGGWDPNVRIEPPTCVPSQEARKRNSIAQNGALPVNVGVPVEGARVGGEGDVSESQSVDLEEKDNRDNVQCTKRLFGGIVGDIKRRYVQYPSDVMDAFQLPSLSPVISSVIFMFFVSFALAYTFGVTYAEKTENLLGPTEMLMACGIGNVVFALFSGQPLIILGATLPLLMFENILYQFCKLYAIPYLQFRFWIGIWVAGLCLVVTTTNASYLVRLFTRFTRESFSLSISVIFIFKAIEGIWLINWESPFSPWILYPAIPRSCKCEWTGDNGDNISRHYLDLYTDHNNLTNEHGQYFTCRDFNPLAKSVGQCPEFYEDNKFVWSVVLFFGTYLVIQTIKRIRNSPYFMAWMRTVISDFAILVSVLLWMFATFLSRISVKSVDIPDVFEQGFTPTACVGEGPACTRRGWIVNPVVSLSGQWIQPGMVFAAFIPAVLLAAVIFTNHQLTATIINNKDNKLKKGHGYHLDFVIVGCLVVLFSVLGLPWIVGATVKSIVHVQGLSVYSSYAPGKKPKFEGVVEQRLSSLGAAILVGVTVIAGRGLVYLPVPILYGLIFLVGITSLNRLQIIDRVLLLFIPDKNKPDYSYVRLIPNRRIYLYTAIQVVGVVLLIAVMATEAAILFPLMILALVVERWIIGFVMTKSNIKQLDDLLPSWMYRRPWCCKYCCERKKKKKVNMLEMGGLMRYEEEPYRRPNTGMSVSSSNGYTTPDNRSTNGKIPSMERQNSSDINMSEEVNRCSLFRHVDHVCMRQSSDKCKVPSLILCDRAKKRLNLENIEECPESPDKHMAFV
jgi:anion exchange protein